MNFAILSSPLVPQCAPASHTRTRRKLQKNSSVSARELKMVLVLFFKFQTHVLSVWYVSFDIHVYVEFVPEIIKRTNTRVFNRKRIKRPFTHVVKLPSRIKCLQNPFKLHNNTILYAFDMHYIIIVLRYCVLTCRFASYVYVDCS